RANVSLQGASHNAAIREGPIRWHGARTRAHAMFLIRLSILAALVVPACTIPNETHCGNLRGDETCAERYGEAMYCDVCVSANDGCVQSVPDAACRFEEHGTGSGNATTSPGSTDPTSSPSTSV